MSSKEILNFFSKINISYSNILPTHNNNSNLNQNSDNKFIKKLFVKLFTTFLNLTSENILYIDNKVNKQILEGLNKIEKKESNGWVYCDKACDEISLLFKDEIESTLYMLNIISNSLVSIDNSLIQFIFHDKIENLNGRWENDKDKFTFKIFNKKSSSYNKTRLIMGFGPSASGKTYCAKAIITMLSNADPFFPKSFLSIDGGIYREKSYVYQKLIGLIKNKTYNGLLNLVLSGVSSKKSNTNTNRNLKVEVRKTLFDSNIVKKKITEYLIYLKFKHNNKVSLYVPETLGGCSSNCSSIYEKYIEIADDLESWIGLLIWQHKTHDTCDYKAEYQCTGCTESGEKREKNEGKKYSSNSWKNSMENGKKYMMIAPGGRYEIHNGGGYKYRNNSNNKLLLTKSVVIDHSSEKKLKNIQNGFILLKNVNNLKKSEYIFVN